MSERPSWASASGLPTAHTARAAMHVAAIIDARGSRTIDAQESYWHRATGGQHPPRDLQLGQSLLVDLGLVVDADDILQPSKELLELLSGTLEDAVADIVFRAILVTPHPVAPDDQADLVAAIPDPERREQLLLALAQRHDDERRAAIGAAGERLVVAEARAELHALDRADLARDVRRVSLISDQLGYDVTAPCLQGAPRRLEVKATVRGGAPTIDVYLTRNEARVGQCTPDWKLVLCDVTDVKHAQGSIRGWWSYADLAARLPRDVAGGEWQQAKLLLEIDDARTGLPSAVL